MENKTAEILINGSWTCYEQEQKRPLPAAHKDSLAKLKEELRRQNLLADISAAKLRRVKTDQQIRVALAQNHKHAPATPVALPSARKRLSTLIMDGEVYFFAQYQGGFTQYVSFTDGRKRYAGCALAMAMAGAGERDFSSLHLGFEKLNTALGYNINKRGAPLPDSSGRHTGRKQTLRHVIEHVNDRHRWPVPKIVAWLQNQGL